MTNQGDIYFNNVVTKEEKDTTLAASCVQDIKTGDIILKLVNAGKKHKTMKIDLSNFNNIIPDADAEDTFENPEDVIRAVSTVKVSKDFDYAAPAMLLTIIRIATKK